MQQGRQQMGQQMGQLGQGMSQGMGSGNTALGQALLMQIQQMKQQLGYGNFAKNGQGQASGGWGLGTTPYADNPAPAGANPTAENRQGDQSLKDTAPVDFEPLYAPEDNAHSFTSENQLHGQFDPSATPEKIEEVRSAPEDQKALTEYADIIGAYTEGEESAVNREQVPLEYQQLVREYFERVAELSNSKASGSADDQASADEDSSATDDDSSATDSTDDESTADDTSADDEAD